VTGLCNKQYVYPLVDSKMWSYCKKLWWMDYIKLFAAEYTTIMLWLCTFHCINFLGDVWVRSAGG